VQTSRPHRRHAVCLTGLQRSLPEIGGNVRRGLLSLLADGPRRLGDGGQAHGDSQFGVFGVRPVNDTWATVRSLLPLAMEETQQLCVLPRGCGRAQAVGCPSEVRHTAQRESDAATRAVASGICKFC
jgi:hypothetical protein